MKNFFNNTKDKILKKFMNICRKWILRCFKLIIEESNSLYLLGSFYIYTLISTLLNLVFFWTTKQKVVSLMDKNIIFLCILAS